MDDYRVSKNISFFDKFCFMALVSILLGAIIFGVAKLQDIQEETFNYHCKKGVLYKSATLNSYVFIRSNDFCLDIRNEPLITEIK
tara:strand:+ start:115 stop:369 length:255 start_codon:yes stop_codon:yes gene_type:complete